MDFSSYFWKFGAGLLFVTSVAVGLLYYHQDSLLYFPTVGGQVPRRTRSNPRKYRSPGEHSIPFEEHFISCSDGVAIHTWILYSKQSTEDQRSSRPTVLFFHGNAGNIGLRLPIGVHMVEYLQVNVMMVEYRGYGDSHDVPKLNEEGLKLDAEAALEFARNHSLLRTTPLFVYGQSLGGAVAFHLAHYAQQRNTPLAGLLIENTFHSISRMVDHLMPYLSLIKPWVLRIRWDSYKIAPKIRTPVLYLSGRKDELVPHSHMLELYQLSRKISLMTRMHIVEDGMHNDTFLKGGMKYWEAMHLFMKEAVSLASTIEHNFSTLRSSTNHHGACPSDAEIMNPSGNSVAVNLGSDGKSITDDTTHKSSIPSIPSNLLGLAREAAVSSMCSSMKDSADDTKKYK